MRKRKSISKKIRFNIFKRDLFTCQYCGAVPPKVILELDHMTPVSKGGTNDKDNLVTSCFDCNRGKSNYSLSDVPTSLKVKAKQTKEKEDQIEGYNQIMKAKRERIESQTWSVAEKIGLDNDGFYKKSNLLSIKRFFEYLSLDEVLDAAEIASIKYYLPVNNRFKYFCAVCWNKIKEGGE